MAELSETWPVLPKLTPKSRPKAAVAEAAGFGSEGGHINTPSFSTVIGRTMSFFSSMLNAEAPPISSSRCTMLVA